MRKVIPALVVTALLLVVLVGAVDAQTYYQKFENIWARSAWIDGGLTVGTDVTIGDSLSVTADATFAGDVVVSPSAVVTLTQDATLTPTGGYMQIASAGTVGTSSILTGTAGQVLRIVNTTNTTIVFTDTGSLKLTGNISLGQYDTLSLMSDGTNWLQLSTANN